MTKINNDIPADYTISIKREVIEGGLVFVARVAELPDLEDYGGDYREAYELICETIELSQAAFIQQGNVFPPPQKYTRTKPQTVMTAAYAPA